MRHETLNIFRVSKPQLSFSCVFGSCVFYNLVGNENESAFTEALRNTVPFLQSKMEAGSTINEFEDKYDGKVTCLNAFLF